MSLYFFTGILYVIATIVGMLLVKKKTDFSFWLILNMYFDPGGYLSIVSNRFLGRIDFQDILIIFIIYSIYRLKGSRRIILKDRLFIKFIRLFLFFSIFYFVIYGAIIPYMKGDLNYEVFLLKSRRYIYGAIILLGVYLFALRGTRQLYRTTLFVALPTIIFFWISVTTPLNFMEYASFERYRGSGIMRIGLNSYGLFQILFPISMIVYFLNQKYKIPIKNKKLLYFVGILILASLLISLTRRTILDVVGSIFIIGYVVSKITKTTLFKIPFRLFPPILLLLSVLFLFKPNYINYITDMATDTVFTITTGKNSQGLEEQRVSGGGIYPEVYAEIRENIFLGTGYTYFTWEFIKSMGSVSATSTRGLHFGQLADAAQEIPIVNMFFSFGIIGFLLLMPLYLKLFKVMRKNYQILRVKFDDIFAKDSYLLVFSVLFVLMISKLFTYNIWSLGDQFIGANFQISAVWFALGFALLQMNKMKINCTTQ